MLDRVIAKAEGTEPAHAEDSRRETENWVVEQMEQDLPPCLGREDWN